MKTRKDFLRSLLGLPLVCSAAKNSNHFAKIADDNIVRSKTIEYGYMHYDERGKTDGVIRVYKGSYMHDFLHNHPRNFKNKP